MTDIEWLREISSYNSCCWDSEEVGRLMAIADRLESLERFKASIFEGEMTINKARELRGIPPIPDDDFIHGNSTKFGDPSASVST